ncbi:TetR/AcrR family transcriptional regulator [Paenibacillus sp. GSMTC-2017]|uniref:TetR/AcrR family transcriptional regulator n=1 Tax=Paenibacillus sp. GSMTC-2017 TaxID=2794350 RepID=UPI0018D76675|nr:TetR/AcrR family transcriptional regulator [Paenibacillus sp. GSMTC-2017]
MVITIAEDLDIKIRILLAAKKLFASQGYDGTTIRQICEEASANVALVSYHFGGKENLYGAIFETFIPSERIATFDKDINPVAGVKQIIKEVTAFRFADPELISIIQQEIVMNSPRIQIIRHHVMPMWKLLQKWINEGREQGYFEYRSLDTAFMSIVGTLLFHRQQKYWMELMVEEKPELESLVYDLTDFIMNGLHYKGE